MFELLDRDANGRTGKFTIGKKEIKTPNIAIVINPNRMLVPPKELKGFGADLIITNSYIIYRNQKLREKAEKGLHKFLNWSGPIYTDSGTFQMYSQNVKDINSEEIIDFQEKIKSDIITPVDMFTLPDDSKETARKKLKETSKRILSARGLTKKTLNAPIQGGLFLDLRKKACVEAKKSNPDLFSIGGIVPLMEQYRFRELCDIILTCKQNLPFSKPVHAFGAGHPMVFSLLTAFGCDLFDSAMYSIAARRGGYLTTNGTHQFENLTEFPCSCPMCANSNPRDVENKEEFLTKHNLYVTFQEIRTIRQAIKEDSLWELVQSRVRSHPKLLEAFEYNLKKYKRFISKHDNISKKSAFFYSGKESEYRPEVILAKERLKKVKSKRYFTKKPFGRIPVELSGVYPFSQSIIPGEPDKRVRSKPEEAVKKTIEYQFGKHKLKKFKVEISRKTGRIRRVYSDKLLGTIRSYDGLFLPTKEGANFIDMKKVVVDDDAVPFVENGKSVFAKFVKSAKGILPSEEVSVVDKKGRILAVGKALLNEDEMKDFNRGMAVKTR